MPGQTATEEVPGSRLLRRSFRAAFPPAVRGEGACLWDSRARQYLDFSGSAAVNFIGHGVGEIVAAMTSEARSRALVHGGEVTPLIADEYARELLDFAGEGFSGGAVYFSSGGPEAVETALKLARQYQVEAGNFARSRIISCHQSSRARTPGGSAALGNRRLPEIDRAVPGGLPAVNAPYCYRCAYRSTDGCSNCGEEYAAEVERSIALSRDKVCAVILEPVGGRTRGAAAPPPGYLGKVREISRKHEVLLIADEVISGMGRTGKAFAVDHWGVTPDMIITARGLSSGYSPLGAVILSKKIAEAISSGSGAFLRGFAYSSHPVSLAAGRRVLRYILERRLVEAADSDRKESAAGQLREKLGIIRELPPVGDVRGLGLLWAVEFVSDRATRAPYPAAMNFSGKVAEAAGRRGLLVWPVQGCIDGTSGDHILIAPPAVISGEQIAWALEQLQAAILEASLRA